MKIVTETLIDGALGASGVVAWRWDLEGRRIDWSPGAEEVIGLPDIVLRSPELLMRAIHPDDLPLVSTAFADALCRGGHMDARFRVIGSHGTRWVDCSGEAIVDDNGEAFAATGTLVDVTEECEAEAAMLETLHDAQVVLGDIGARVWEFDAAAETIQYLTPPTGPPILAEAYEEEISLSVALERVSEEDAVMIRAKLQHAVAAGEPMSFEAICLDDDGLSHRVFVRGTKVSGSSNRLTGVTIVLD